MISPKTDINSVWRSFGQFPMFIATNYSFTPPSLPHHLYTFIYAISILGQTFPLVRYGVNLNTVTASSLVLLTLLPASFNVFIPHRRNLKLPRSVLTTWRSRELLR